MKALRTLNPLFWKYRNRLVAGFVFIIFTNGLAVFAPALVGEGINVLREAYVNYLEPVANATNETEITAVFERNKGIELPQILATISDWIGISSDCDCYFSGNPLFNQLSHQRDLPLFHTPNHHRELTHHGV